MDFTNYIAAAKGMSSILTCEKGMTCMFVVISKAYIEQIEHPELALDNRGHKLHAGDWYIIITCQNGYRYYVNVSHDSVCAMCAEVFGFIQYK